eukprot:9385966-Alexandrium_andersonii.AAC.1
MSNRMKCPWRLTESLDLLTVLTISSGALSFKSQRRTSPSLTLADRYLHRHASRLQSGQSVFGEAMATAARKEVLGIRELAGQGLATGALGSP